MGIAHILGLASKFVVRGTVFRAGKHLAVKGGKAGIGAFSLLAGGYMFYSLLKKREKWEEDEERRRQRQLARKNN